jgi:uncharacterized protein
MSQNYRQTIIDYIRANANPPDKFGHQPRLYRLAVEIAAGRPFDDDVVFAAAWMHDLGVFIGHRPEDIAALIRWDMIAYAVKTVPGLLERFGFPPSKIPAVIQVIQNHAPAFTPPSFEAEIIRDADILEQLGSIGICRTAAKVGRDTRFANFTDAAKALRKNLDTLPSQLRLESARRLAAPRISVLRAFLESLENEAAGCEY